MTIARQIKDRSITGRKHSRSVRDMGYVFEPCRRQPVVTGVNPATVPTGLNGTFALVTFRDFVAHLQYVGAATTLGPKLSQTNALPIGTRLTMSLDFAASEGVQYAFGGETSAKSGSLIYTAGQSNPVFAEVVIQVVGSLANCADFSFGWRGAEAFETAVDDYEDLAAINVQIGAAPPDGAVFIETIVGGAATATAPTGVGISDLGDDITFKIVIANDVPKFYINGNEYGPSVPYQFTSGLFLQPFMFILTTAGGGCVWTMKSFEAGPVSEVARGL